MSGRRCKALRREFVDRYSRAPMRTLRAKRNEPPSNPDRTKQKRWWRMGWLIQDANVEDDKARIRSEWRAVKRACRETRRAA
jgi:hypothetical protein